MNPLVSDDPWTTHAGISEDTVSIEEEEDVAYVDHNLADGEVESHHGLYWKRAGVLEEPQRKMLKTIGRLKPEFVNNFGTPLDSIMSIFPLIYWKIISHEMNEDAHMKLEQQFDTTGKRTISGSRWTHDTAFREILQFYRVLMMMILFPLPGATYTAYWSYGSPMFPRTNTIALRRFKQLRSALHFNSNTTEVKGKYALHKMCPLLNILKKTFVIFLIPCSEMLLHEASCASRSNYGHELIFLTRRRTAASFIFDFTFSVMHQHLFVLHSRLQQGMIVTQLTLKKHSRVFNRRRTNLY
jgi:hypothetical protein